MLSCFGHAQASSTHMTKQVSIEQQRVLDAFLGRGADTPSGGQAKFAWQHGDTAAGARGRQQCWCWHVMCSNWLPFKHCICWLPHCCLQWRA